MQDYKPEAFDFSILGELLEELPDVPVPVEYRPTTIMEKGLDFIGMEPHTEPEGDLFAFYVNVSVLSQLAAFALSYNRNKDLKWALVHGFMGPVYLGYLTAKFFALHEAKGLERLFQR